ncbi:MAG: ATP synthase subunit gamma [Prochlorococcus sp. TMED223]|uniref:ATP synthase gamma chain n=1 Tax=Prochlorococcus marinus (strain MIT 9303) TaxID=59922 RepID=ATPG_PROM3|nr:F0F1 ATP synthase subunit gamma [Prochlorococcus marinus]A2C6X6.1 RecName: Full=ATP synthase gamma chain; AltName: Full=ATP synthase F1 sector gamma subunit; AltName: Full=F-ATPase gamma subunit [Prochlorococcus marinus str. MIT 9303]ABM77236.1 ATP synthase gamma subunit [Prochlorococcus marinus str. MIT 9303]MEC9452815.1 F0F1 ATP synthase subunit gamma [Cyanobacteriota bacterium]RPF98917.1 MAG: ATP synthase subunit gamma [Prochlorococcus sp. TMED223]|tara:strand:- start:148 stop:1098 length:951 start_codon:yes stop_codon:yes gene_type:complete
MANLKDIRDRIVSVKNTRKITEAMRLVAAAKVRRAQEQVLRSRPFADRLARVLENIQSRMSFEMADAPLLKTSDLKTITLLAVTGDRGLCGGYNSNIIKRTEQRYAELNGQGYKVDLVLIGRKAITYFSNRSSQYTIRATFTGLEQVPTSDDAESITTEVLAEFLSQSTDRIEVIYTKFINLVSCNPVVQTLLPLDPQGIAEADDEIFRLTTKDSRLTVEKGVGPANEQPPLPSDIIFEQSPEQLLNALLPLYLQNQMLRALQESAASELASRMTAMNNASDNAKALAKTLTLDYNKARQAAITQEILEVVGGSCS